MRRLITLTICLLFFLIAGCGQKAPPSPRRDLHYPGQAKPQPAPQKSEKHA